MYIYISVCAQGERTDPDSDVGWIRGGPCGYNPCVEIKSSNLIFMILLLFLMVALVITTVGFPGARRSTKRIFSPRLWPRPRPRSFRRRPCH